MIESQKSTPVTRTEEKTDDTLQKKKEAPHLRKKWPIDNERATFFFDPDGMGENPHAHAVGA